MINFPKPFLHFFHARIWNLYPLGIKVITNAFLFFILLFSGTAFAQTLPPASSCTSNDLQLVAATLTGGDICNSCTPGSTISRTLTLSINNKTGSTRTSFAFWGTLEIYNADGTLKSSTARTGCNGPILKNQINSVDFGTITYGCGESMKITNLFLAWTDASPGSTCPLNPATINPKCGTLPSIQVNAGVDGSFIVTNITCFGSKGSIDMTPFGGKAPYTFQWTATNGGVVPAGQATNEDLSNLVPGTYTVTIKDANNCTTTKSRNVTGPTAALAVGTCGKTDATCAGGDGSVSAGAVSNAVGTVSYSWKNASNVVVGNAANVNNLSAGTYTLTVTDACSSATGSATVGAPTPIATPSAGVTQQPNCNTATGTVTVTSPASGITYTLTQGGIVKYTAVNGVFGSVAAGTYGLNASNGNCSAAGNNVTVNQQPSTPAAPSAGVTQPSCSVATGTITVNNANSNLTYVLTGPSPAITTRSNNTGLFENLASGTYSLTAASNGCTSSATPETINQAPGAPAAPSLKITQPSLCGPSTGSIEVCNPIVGYTYTLVGGQGIVANGQPVVFSNLAAGSNPAVTVTNTDGCTSAAANCTDAAASCSSQLVSARVASSTNELSSPVSTANDLLLSQTTVKAYPNPFNDKVKFVVTAAQAGKGTLEVFNMLGQKVKTVYEGFVPAGTNNFELSLPGQKNSTLIYRFRMGENQLTGKLLQITR